MRRPLHKILFEISDKIRIPMQYDYAGFEIIFKADIEGILNVPWRDAVAFRRIPKETELKMARVKLAMKRDKAGRFEQAA